MHVKYPAGGRVVMTECMVSTQLVGSKASIDSL
jgi:hypothetical protein